MYTLGVKISLLYKCRLVSLDKTMDGDDTFIGPKITQQTVITYCHFIKMSEA